MAITALLTSIYLIFLGVIMNTENFKSMVIFKLLPIVLGVLTILYNLDIIKKLIGA